MTGLPDPLPTDATALHALVAAQQLELATLRQTLSEQQQTYAQLHEQLRLLIHKRFGVSSEKTPPAQLGLFDEAERDADSDAEVAAPVITVQGHQRQRHGRQRLPQSLPRVEIVYDLEEAEKVCPYDELALEVIGYELSEQLDIVPAKIQLNTS